MYDPDIYTTEILARITRALESTPIKENMAVPGDGNDPTAAVNHDEGQHITMRQHQDVHTHLRKALEHLQHASNLTNMCEPHGAAHQNHLNSVDETINDATHRVHQAVTHLSSANQSALKPE